MPIRMWGLVLAVSLLGEPALAQWVEDGTPVCRVTYSQIQPAIVQSDSGAIIFWADNRSGVIGNWDIYTQKIGLDGICKWNNDGLAVCNSDSLQIWTAAVSDGEGGAIAIWSDDRQGNHRDIYGQRIDKQGAMKWTINGVEIESDTFYNYIPAIVSDGEKGVIIAWMEYENTNYYKIFAQRVDSNGNICWPVGGIIVCSRPITVSWEMPQIANDGSGGAIICWSDTSGGIVNSIYAQRLDHDGQKKWAENGILVYGDSLDQYPFSVISDNAGGAIIFRPSVSLYAHRLDSSGQQLWPSEGFVVREGNPNFDITAAINQKGQICVSWTDDRNGNFDIYAQIMDTSGLVYHQPVGIDICTAMGEQSSPQVEVSNQDGFIITWKDKRASVLSDIYSQRVDTIGSIMWNTHIGIDSLNGLAVCDYGGSQFNQKICADGYGGAIITWEDRRDSATINDIYAQRITKEGVAGIENGINARSSSGLTLKCQVFPNPILKNEINFLYQINKPGLVNIDIYNACGQHLKTIFHGSKEPGVYTYNYRLHNSNKISSGIYFYQIKAAGQIKTGKIVVLK